MWKRSETAFAFGGRGRGKGPGTVRECVMLAPAGDCLFSVGLVSLAISGWIWPVNIFPAVVKGDSWKCYRGLLSWIGQCVSTDAPRPPIKVSSLAPRLRTPPPVSSRLPLSCFLSGIASIAEEPGLT